MLYLDHHATTPCDPEVVARMLPFFTDHFGNPSSKSHPVGRHAALAVEEARRDLASLLSANPRELVFTSGATEALNLALRGLVHAYPDRPQRLVVAAFEHKAVLDTAKDLAERHALTLDLVPIDPRGLVTPDALTFTLAGRPALAVAIMAANNELGTIQDTAALAAIAHAHGAFFVCDAVQAVGRIPFAPRDLGVDLAALSAHKLYGPKGVGALWIRAARDGGPTLTPLMTGGGQEDGLRPGTLNVPAIVGLGAAAALARDRLERDATHLHHLRAMLLSALTSELAAHDLPDDLMRVTCDPPDGPPPPRLPGSLHVTFARLEGFRLLHSLADALSVSTGSACSSERKTASHVLDAIALPDDRRFSALRIGLGRTQTEDEMLLAARTIAAAVARLSAR